MEIKPIERNHHIPDGYSISVVIDDLNNLEADFKEAIETLLSIAMDFELTHGGAKGPFKYEIDIIEKAYKMKWEDIIKEI